MMKISAVLPAILLCVSMAWAQPSTDSLQSLLANERYEEVFQQTQQLLQNSADQTTPSLRYLNIQAAAGMASEQKMTIENFDKHVSAFIGQPLFIPKVECVSMLQAGMNSLYFMQLDTIQFASLVYTTRKSKPLLFQMFRFDSPMDENEFVGNEVAVEAVLSDFSIQEDEELWIGQMTLSETSLKKLKPIEGFTPVKRPRFDTAAATHTFYITGTKLITQSEVDSMIEATNRRTKGMNVIAKVRSREVRNDTAFQEFALHFESNDDDEVTALGEMAEAREILKGFVGKPLPAFRFRDMNGKMVNSKKFKGKPVVINFWFTTCPPCIAEMPEMNRIKEEYAKSDVIFLSMTFEKKEKVESFLQKRSFTYRTIPDVRDYIKQFTRFFPVSLFIGRDGNIQHFMHGMPGLAKFPGEKEHKVDPTKFMEHLISIAGPPPEADK